MLSDKVFTVADGRGDESALAFKTYCDAVFIV